MQERNRDPEPKRRGHRYSAHPSNHTISIDYRDRRSVNYLDHSHHGDIHTSSDGSLTISIQKWATILSHAKWRYNHLREKLELQVTSTDGLAYLRSKYPL